MNKTNKIIVAIVITMFGIVLFATNPNKNQFKEHLKHELRDSAKAEGGVVSMFSGLTSEMSVWAADTNIDKGNFLLFSSYSININNKKHIYIGGLNHFVKLN